MREPAVATITVWASKKTFFTRYDMIFSAGISPPPPPLPTTYISDYCTFMPIFIEFPFDFGLFFLFHPFNFTPPPQAWPLKKAIATLSPAASWSSTLLMSTPKDTSSSNRVGRSVSHSQIQHVSLWSKFQLRLYCKPSWLIWNWPHSQAPWKCLRSGRNGGGRWYPGRGGPSEG